MATKKGSSAPGMAAVEKKGGLEFDKKKLDVTNSGYSTASAKCTSSVSGAGKWYFETRILGTGGATARIGWATDECEWGDSLGSCAGSWGFDASQKRKFAEGGSPEAYGNDDVAWHQGDIVGCLLEVTRQGTASIAYTYNGDNLGTAFSFVPSSHGTVFRPAATLQRRARLLFNFGEEEYCCPQPGAASLFAKVPPEGIAELERLFDKYSGNEMRAEDDTRAVEGEGILALAADLGQKGDMDPLLLIVMWKLGCKKQWAISHDEFVQGFAAVGAAGIPAMHKKADEWRALLEDADTFADLYAFAFEYLRGEAKVLPTADAAMAWQMLGFEQKWPLWHRWEEFFVKGAGGVRKTVTRDNWQQLLPFSRQFPKNTDNYDPLASCWPSLFDEFAEWLTRRK